MYFVSGVSPHRKEFFKTKYRGVEDFLQLTQFAIRQQSAKIFCLSDSFPKGYFLWQCIIYSAFIGQCTVQHRYGTCLSLAFLSSQLEHRRLLISRIYLAFFFTCCSLYCYSKAKIEQITRTVRVLLLIATCYLKASIVIIS